MELVHRHLLRRAVAVERGRRRAPRLLVEQPLVRALLPRRRRHLLFQCAAARTALAAELAALAGGSVIVAATAAAPAMMAASVVVCSAEFAPASGASEAAAGTAVDMTVGRSRHVVDSLV